MRISPKWDHKAEKRAQVKTEACERLSKIVTQILTHEAAESKREEHRERKRFRMRVRALRDMQEQKRKKRIAIHRTALQTHKDFVAKSNKIQPYEWDNEFNEICLFSSFTQTTMPWSAKMLLLRRAGSGSNSDTLPSVLQLIFCFRATYNASANFIFMIEITIKFASKLEAGT